MNEEKLASALARLKVIRAEKAAAAAAAKANGNEEIDPPTWKVQVKGERCSESWEISVVRLDNSHGQRSWGWFDETKLLVSHNGGACHWPIVGFVWDHQIAIAHELCRRLNAGESVNEANETEESNELRLRDGGG